jgi:uncharacterized protein
MMRAVIDDDLSSYAAATLPWLEREPVLNNVFCSLIAERLGGAVPLEDGCLWVRVYDGDDLAGVALRTPPFELLVSALSPEAAEAVAGALAGRDLPGVRGIEAGTGTFVPAWHARTGDHAERTMAQRMYELDTVISPVGVPGRLRVATADDAPLASSWSHAFHDEAIGAGHVSSVRDDRVHGWVAQGIVWLWEVGGTTVSMAMARPSAVRLPRVSLVYTPPEHRRRGYAGAAVAALSQHLLDTGAQGCMLFTDLANPTSNSVYQRIGYRPVADADVWRFTARSRTSGRPGAG